MIITCPECSATFDIPIGLLGEDGRMVKCAKCAHQWHQANPEASNRGDLPEQESPYKPLKEGVTATASEIDFGDEGGLDDPSHDIMKNLDEPSAPVRDIVAQKSAFWQSQGFIGVVVFVLLAGIFYGLTYTSFKDKAFFNRVYQGFDLVEASNFDNVNFDRINISLFENDGVYAADIRTNIINLSQEPVTLGTIRARIANTEGDYIDGEWFFDAPVNELGAESSATFEARLNDVTLPDLNQSYSVALDFIQKN